MQYDYNIFLVVENSIHIVQLAAIQKVPLETALLSQDQVALTCWFW